MKIINLNEHNNKRALDALTLAKKHLMSGAVTNFVLIYQTEKEKVKETNDYWFGDCVITCLGLLGRMHIIISNFINDNEEEEENDLP